MNSQQVQDMRLMYEAVYNDELWELANEYNNTIYDEDIVEVATEYFYTYGLNEDGIDILIEKVGLDNFVEFVYDLSEDLILTEARKVSKAKKQPGSLRSRQQEKLAAQRAASDRKEVERKEPESKGADTEAKAEQPKKKPVRDAIARNIFRAVGAYNAGMERHKSATATAGRLAGETGKTLGKIASFAGEAGRRAGEHVKKHGMKSLANSYEYDTFDAILEHLIAEGYADTNESALAIMANMSEEWREEILDEANKMEKKYNVPNWDKVYDRNERDFPNNTRKPERRSSGKLETPNQTTKRVGKQRRKDHVDTRGVKQIPGAKGIRMQFGRAF